jgi:myo-inositol-1(or 4)-monophosphatase
MTPSIPGTDHAVANTPQTPDLWSLLDLATRAAQSGGIEIRRRLGNATGVFTKSSSTDPVSDADRAGERAVVELIRRERPRDGLLGEEGSNEDGTTGLRWVIDPLDGTVNYLYGVPCFAVSIACEQVIDGRAHPLVGVVLDVTSQEVFTAVRGGGAHLDGKPLRVTEAVGLQDALVATGFAYLPESRHRQALLLTELLPRIRDIRTRGSAALELCQVAAGRCDAYFEDELKVWDWAAGALIAQEAGAAVTALGSQGVLAAGPSLHRDLAALVTPTGT